LRMLRTVEAAREIFSSASWLAIRTRSQLTLVFVISHTKEAISVGVLFTGILELF